jgi:hypothetical protein
MGCTASDAAQRVKIPAIYRMLGENATMIAYCPKEDLVTSVIQLEQTNPNDDLQISPDIAGNVKCTAAGLADMEHLSS